MDNTETSSTVPNNLELNYTNYTQDSLNLDNLTAQPRLENNSLNNYTFNNSHIIEFILYNLFELSFLFYDKIDSFSYSIKENFSYSANYAFEFRILSILLTFLGILLLLIFISWKIFGYRINNYNKNPGRFIFFLFIKKYSSYSGSV